MTCDICGSAIQPSDFAGENPIGPRDYNKTCQKHRHLAKIFDKDAYKKTFGSFEYIATNEELENNAKSAEKEKEV